MSIISYLKSKKAAYFFVLDVLIGVFIFIMAVVLISSYRDSSPSLGAVEQHLNTLSTSFFQTPLRSFDFQNNDIALQISFDTYNSLLTVDELVAILCHNGDCALASDIIGNASKGLPASVGFSYSLGSEEIFYRPSRIGDKTTSIVKLARQKITIVSPNITTEYPINISTIEVWQ